MEKLRFRDCTLTLLDRRFGYERPLLTQFWISGYSRLRQQRRQKGSTCKNCAIYLPKMLQPGTNKNFRYNVSAPS